MRLHGMERLLPAAALGLVFGVVVGRAGWIGPGLLLLGSVTLAGLCLVLGRSGRAGRAKHREGAGRAEGGVLRPGGLALALPVWALFGVLGVLRGAEGDPPLPVLPEGELWVWIQVEEAPRRERVRVDQKGETQQHARLPARVFVEGAEPSGWRMEVRGWPADLETVRGDVWVARAVLTSPAPAIHPLAFDGEGWARRQGSAGGVRLRAEPLRVRQSRRPLAGLDRWRLRMEEGVRAGGSGDAVEVVLAMTTGSRLGIDPAVRARFADTGTAHVLAVSGMHLGLIALLVHSLLARLLVLGSGPGGRRLAQERAALCALPLIGAFVLLTGAPTSAMRAGVMAAVVLVALGLRRPVSALHGLSLAVLWMVAWTPARVEEVAFQLSVSATLGLVLWALLGRGEARGRPRGWMRRGLRRVGDSLMVSTVATLATAPALLWHFGAISLLGPLANLVMVPPLALVALPSGLLGALLHAAGLPGAFLASGIARLAAEGALAIAAWCEASGWMVRTLLVWGRPSVAGLVGWSLLLVPLIAREAGSLRRWGLLLVALGLLAQDPPPWLAPSPTLRVTMIPVGQGDSTLVEFPGGGTLLVDGGGTGRPGPGPGRHALLPFLRGMGHARIDWVASTHGHADHVAGLLEILPLLRPREVWSGTMDRSGDWDRALRAMAEEVGAEFRLPHQVWRGIRVPAVGRLQPWRHGPWEEVRVEILPTPEGMSLNDASLMLRICWGPDCALLTGDAERDREAFLVARSVPIRASYLKVGHHGSATSSTPAFAEAVRPQVAAVHVGRQNRFGHPHDGVLRRWEGLGAKVVRSDAGAIWIWEAGSRSGPRLFRNEIYGLERWVRIQYRSDGASRFLAWRSL